MRQSVFSSARGLAVIMSMQTSFAVAQQAVESNESLPSVGELIGELQEERSLIPFCTKAFTCKWSYFNLNAGKLESVETLGVEEISDCFLYVRNKADGERFPIPISMMSPASKRLLHQYAGYSKRCRQALENLIAANGGSRMLEWTGGDGIRKRGTVDHILLLSEGGAFENVTPTGISLFATAPDSLSGGWIPWHSFSQESKERLLKLTGPVAVPDGKSKPAAYPRNEVPSFNQSDFKGGQSENCGPNAVADFVVWWDRIGLLPLPVSKKDERDKAEWVHQRLYGVMRSGGGTSRDAMLGGFKSYLARYYPRLASAKFTLLTQAGYNSGVEQKPFTLQTVAEHVQGANAAILEISQVVEGRAGSGHYVALTTADAEGNVTINTWGYRFRGKLKQLSTSEIQQLPARMSYGSHNAMFEIVIENPSTTMSREERRWLVLPGDGLLVIEPVFPR